MIKIEQKDLKLFSREWRNFFTDLSSLGYHIDFTRNNNFDEYTVIITNHEVCLEFIHELGSWNIMLSFPLSDFKTCKTDVEAIEFIKECLDCVKYNREWE